MKGFIGVREAKKTVKYRLPIDKEQESLFTNSGSNKC